jgi:hypothetical protein
VGEFGSDANVICARYGGFVERMIFWQGVDTVITAERAIAELKAQKSTSCLNVDATGVGAGVAPYIRQIG